MFGKKKIEDTPQDVIVKGLRSECNRLTMRIRECAIHVIVCNNVIDLYPEGADRERAMADAQTAKEMLITTIGEYDNAKNQYHKSLQSINRNTTIYYSPMAPSHTLVERVYEGFQKRG